MSTQTEVRDQRKETRVDSSDVIRWKRSGRCEDNKAWTIDRSPSSYGFMTRAELSPDVGDQIHIRRHLEDGNWFVYDNPFRVARTESVTYELVLVGCTAESQVDP